MDQETWDLAKALDADLKPIKYGDSVLYPPLMAGGKPFHFKPDQIRFLYALQKFEGDMNKACIAAMVSDEWAGKFITSRKFKEYRNSKLAAMGVRSGELVDEFWETIVAGMRGYREFYRGSCELCHEDNIFAVTEAETFRQDDMTFRAGCKICMQPIFIEYVKEDYKPSREQVQCMDMVGSRLVPKVERIQHEFSSEEFRFISGDAA